MENDLMLVARQLARMRGMNARYHARFFADIRFTTVLVLALLTLGIVVDRWLFLAIPVMALMGAAQTAFDASYLIFSRHYAARLERELNTRAGRDVLVAHRLEDSYLFPLDQRKFVTLSFGGPGFTWFGFMTGFYTLIGIGAYALGLGLSLDVIEEQGTILYGGIYLCSLAVLTLLALGVGLWWFVGGEGERRLRSILDESFPPASD